MLIRPEQPSDHDAIHELTRIAFAPMPYSAGTESDIIRRLRADGDLTVSLVAEHDGEIVGHVAFSPVSVDGRHDGWFGLGPISVKAEMQRQGIGKALISAGLAVLGKRGAHGCALVGNPEIYGRVGFISDGRLTCGDIDSKYVQWLALDGSTPRGVLTFAPGFGL